MTAATAVAPPTGRIQRLQDLGERLFIAPRPAWPLAFARIIIGFGVLGWAISLTFEVSAFLSDDGLIAPEFAETSFRWIKLDSEVSVRLALSALMAVAVAIIVGWRPTIWLFIAFVLLVSIQRRNPYILNSGDIILRNLTLLLAFCPTGAALSVDRVRRHGRAALFTSSLVAPWGIRVVQLQMMVVYLFAVKSKSGEFWSDGSAVSTVFRLTDLHRFGPPAFMVDSVAFVTFLTWSTLLLELALAMLLWAKPLRPVLVVLGVLLHLTIDVFVLVGFFGVAMIAGLMTFLDADRIDRRVSGRRGQADDDVELDDSAPSVASTT